MTEPSGAGSAACAPAASYSDLAFQALDLMLRVDRRQHTTNLLISEIEKLGAYYR
jgi:hypothetical protein